MWVLTVRGYFTATEAQEKGWRNFKWNKLQGGDWDIPQSAKQNIFAAEKDYLFGPFLQV